MIKQKVLIITTVHDADDRRIFDKECKALLDAGIYDIHLAAPGSISPSNQINWIPLGQKPSLRFWRIIRSQLLVFKLGLNIKADIWHIHDPEIILASFIVCKIKNTKLIWDSHENYLMQIESRDTMKAWIPNSLRPLVYQILKYIVRLVDKHASGIVGANDEICKTYRNSRVALVGNECKVQDFAQSRPNEKNRIILFTGHPGDNMCFKELVLAVQQIPEVTLAIAGNAMDMNLWEWTKSILGSRVSHLGWLTTVQLASEMSKCILGAATYSNSPVNQTNSPTKIYEFMSASLPVLATPTRRNSAIIEASGGGVLANGFNRHSIKESIELAISTPKLWNVWSESGRKWVLVHGNWDTSRDNLLSLYDDISRIDS